MPQSFSHLVDRLTLLSQSGLCALAAIGVIGTASISTTHVSLAATAEQSSKTKPSNANPSDNQNISQRSPREEEPAPPEVLDTLRSPTPDLNNRPGIFEPFKSEPEPEAVPEKEFAVPENTFDLYRLGPGDSIAIIVERFTELNFQGAINPEGSIILPLIGVVPIEGLTVKEVEEKLEVEFDRYVIDPSVSVTLLARRPVQVTVIGEIVRPGFYPLGAPSVTAALLSAGGTKTTADLRKIIIRRTMPDGSTLERSVDLFTPLQVGAPLPKEQLQDGDVVEISKWEAGAEEAYDPTVISRSTLAQPVIRIRIINRAGGGFSTITVPNGSNFGDIVASFPSQGINLKRIALIRFDPEQGKAVTQKLNGKKALMGDEMHNVPLLDNDVVALSPTFITRVTSLLNSFTQPFRDTLGFLLFFRELGDSAEGLFGPTGR